ncbi:hypothetical protein CsSME_00040904 [Camellia sinensis var. sinensis]
MSEVAQKLEQLEEVMGHAQEDGMSHLASETVQYNPSDLSSWLESMISELHPLPNFDSSLPLPSAFDSHRHPINHRIFQDSSSDDYDLKAIAGKAVKNVDVVGPEHYRMERANTVADVNCTSCRSLLGWNFVRITQFLL